MSPSQSTVDNIRANSGQKISIAACWEASGSGLSGFLSRLRNAPAVLSIKDAEIRKSQE